MSTSTFGTRSMDLSDQPGTIRRCKGEIFLQGKNLPSEKEPANCKVAKKFVDQWLPDSSILGPDKVHHPVAVEALFGYEKLKAWCRHVESHIAISWTLIIFIGVEKAWPKPNNLHISGRMIDICGIPIQIWMVLKTSLTLQESYLPLLRSRLEHLWPAYLLCTGQCSGMLDKGKGGVEFVQFLILCKLTVPVVDRIARGKETFSCAPRKSEKMS